MWGFWFLVASLVCFLFSAFGGDIGNLDLSWDGLGHVFLVAALIAYGGLPFGPQRR